MSQAAFGPLVLADLLKCDLCIFIQYRDLTVAWWMRFREPRRSAISPAIHRAICQFPISVQLLLFVAHVMGWILWPATIMATGGDVDFGGSFLARMVHHVRRSSS